MRSNRLSPRLRDGLAASGLAVAMSWRNPAPACASGWGATGDGGIFVGAHFGNPRQPAAFTFGVEARGIFIDAADSCNSHFQTFGGAVARIELIGWHRSRLMLGPVMGATNGGVGYAAELTAGIERGTEPGLVLQAGGEVSALLLLNARGGYAFGRDGEFAVGLRFPPLSTSSSCVSTTGRPLRRNDARAPVAGAQWCAPPRDRARDDSAARVWTERACLEWASVPAFCELAQQLQASGAPATLIARAREAAADELRHAVLSAETAASLAGAPALGLDPPVTSDRAAAGGGAGVVRLAVESYLDGCIGEATAAAVAAREADLAGDADLARMQGTIARDEARHAELAWDILAWTLAVEPKTTRAALANLGATPSHAPAPGAEAGPNLERFGILDSSRVHAVASEQRVRAQARLASRLTA